MTHTARFNELFDIASALTGTGFTLTDITLTESDDVVRVDVCGTTSGDVRITCEADYRRVMEAILFGIDDELDARKSQARQSWDTFCSGLA